MRTGGFGVPSARSIGCHMGVRDEASADRQGSPGGRAAGAGQGWPRTSKTRERCPDSADLRSGSLGHGTIAVGREQSCDGRGRRCFASPGGLPGLESNVGNPRRARADRNGRRGGTDRASATGALSPTLAQLVAVGINGFQEVQVAGGRDRWSTVSQQRFANLERAPAHPAVLFD